MEPEKTALPDEADLKAWDTPVFQELPVSASEASIHPTGTDGPFNYS
jgi:hypothetical protein